MLCQTELGSPSVGFLTSLSPALGVSLAQTDRMETEEEWSQFFTLVLWKTALGSRVLVLPGLFLFVFIQQMSSHLL